MKGEMSFLMWFARLVALAGVIFFAVFLYAIYATAHPGSVSVNGKLANGYTVEFAANGDIKVSTLPMDFPCNDMGGSYWQLGNNVNWHAHHIGYIPFKAVGSGRFVLSSNFPLNVGISKCPAGYWESNSGCGYGAKSSVTVNWRAGRTDNKCNLQYGKTYFLTIRSPECPANGTACKVSITK